MSSTPDPYNYRRFDPADYMFDRFTGLAAGEKYVDCELTTLDGTTVHLSDYLDRPIVLETGSVTCPMYAQAVTPMQEFAAQYPEMNFLVLYVREAHPGDRTQAHDAFDDKCYNAQRLRATYGERRTVLIDSVDGHGHQEFGSLPNSIYVIDIDGTVLFRSTWNNTDKLPAILSALRAKRSFDTSDFKPISPNPLWIGGPLAIRDFVKGLPRLLTMHRHAGNL
jgi:peroxiredoxin